MRGKTCIVTGANSGMGKVTAIALARMGARVFIVCRSEKNGNRARLEIIQESNNSQVELLVADLGSQRQVRAATEAFAAKCDRLDVLVNNAGSLGNERTLSEDGIELTFAVNHLGPYLFTNLLLPQLRAAQQGRVVVVASEVHRLAKFDLDNIQLAQGYGAYKAYCISKLANIMFTLELARRCEGTSLTANCLHPGVVGSSFGSGAGLLMRTAMLVSRPFLRSSAKGAETAIYLASSPEAAPLNGRYLYDKKELQPTPVARDPKAALDLWNMSADMVGLKPSPPIG